MKLQQNQIWLKGTEYLRIVQLERLEVQYKTLTDPLSGRGPHQTGARVKVGDRIHR